MIKTDFSNYNYNKNINNSASAKANDNMPLRKNSSIALDTVSFKGHLGAEKLAKDGITWLRHETALFRDMQTKEFVKNYILENFADKNKIKMIVGGCSSGEEAFTHSMLLKELQDKLKIIGFDLSQKSVEEAKSRKVLMQRIKEPPDKIHGYVWGAYDKSFQDSYLCFPVKDLTKEQTARKVLFDEFFEISSEIPKEEKLSLGTRFKYWYLKKLFKMLPPTFESKFVKLKDNMAENCEFVQGDIMNIGEITKGEKAEVITFTNAMYHLISNDIGTTVLRMPKKNAEEITRKIAASIKENLVQKGIFVLGEDEVLQTMDSEIVPRVFKEFGFKPLNAINDHAANVWQLL